MCLAVEITMTLVGVVVMILGKLYLSSELRLTGLRARVAGLLLALPLPLVYGLGFLLGTMIGLELVPPSTEVYFTAFEYVLVASAPILVVLMAFLSKPTPAAPAKSVSDDVQGYLAEGKRWLEQGYDSLAANACDKAIQINPRCLEAYGVLALAHARCGNWEASTRALQAALELQPRHAANHYHISLCYERLGRSEQAERERKIAMKLEPSYSTFTDDAWAALPPAYEPYTKGDRL